MINCRFPSKPQEILCSYKIFALNFGFWRLLAMIAELTGGEHLFGRGLTGSRPGASSVTSKRLLVRGHFLELTRVLGHGKIGDRRIKPR